MKKNFFWLLLLIITAHSCTTRPDRFRVSDDANLLIPLGSSSFRSFTTEIFKDGRPCVWKEKNDGFGNSWAAIAVSDITNPGELVIRYTVNRQNTETYRDVTGADTDWLQPNRYIDWKNQSIQTAAGNLKLDGLDRREAAVRIGRYVQSKVIFSIENSMHPASIPASETLASGKGVCINFSRLFISLCRAAGIPARSVNGIVRDHDRKTEYDFHHEWMEYLSEDGNWHQIDLTYSVGSVLNDPRYAGFVHGAEDHPWFARQTNKELGSGLPVQLEKGDVILFHYHPIFPSARFGFRLVESRDMEHYVIEKTMKISKTQGSIIISSVQPGEETVNQLN